MMPGQGAKSLGCAALLFVGPGGALKEFEGAGGADFAAFVGAICPSGAGNCGPHPIRRGAKKEITMGKCFMLPISARQDERVLNTAVEGQT